MRTAILLVLALAGVATPALAQIPQRLPRVIVDVRGFYTGLGQDPTTAAALILPPTALPKRAPGGAAGIHLYLIRRQQLSFGISAEGVLARATKTNLDTVTGVALNQPVSQELRGVSGNLTLNFGHRDGWSYLTAGMGPTSFATWTGAKPADRPPVQMMINMGAGARWFFTRHIAIGFDLRFYQTDPQEPTAYPGRDRSKLRVLSLAFALR